VIVGRKDINFRWLPLFSLALPAGRGPSLQHAKVSELFPVAENFTLIFAQLLLN